MAGNLINSILLLGAGLLGAAFFPIKSLVDRLPEGSLRKRWSEVRALILFFVAGYLTFVYFRWMDRQAELDLIVPAVFFFSAVMILFIGRLAIDTAFEIQRTADIEHKNVTDHLTGIYNRRYLDERILQEIQRSHRYGLPFSFLLLDIDHFKSINDTHGHLVGDEVLKTLGKVLGRELRETDVLARYGGEELAVLAVHTPVADAANLAERLRRAVEASVMVPADESGKRPAIRITVSIGLAGAHNREVSDPQALIERADKALYRAKAGGRNRFVAFDGTEAA